MSRKVSFKDWILFEDDNYIAINKPPHVATLDDRAATINVLSLAKEYWQDAQVCHRLDKETSGVLLLSKNSAAYRNAAVQFEKRQVRKVYHAVVEGIHEFKQESIELPIEVRGNGPVRISHKDGKPSTTIVSTIGFGDFTPGSKYYIII